MPLRALRGKSEYQSSIGAVTSLIFHSLAVIGSEKWRTLDNTRNILWKKFRGVSLITVWPSPLSRANVEKWRALNDTGTCSSDNSIHECAGCYSPSSYKQKTLSKSKAEAHSHAKGPPTGVIGIDKKFQSFSFFCCSLCTEEVGVFMQKKSVRLSVCPSVQYNLGL